MTTIDITPNANREPTEEALQHAIEGSPLGADFTDTANEVTRWLGTELALVWQEFDRRLEEVPIIKKLNQGEFTKEDYLTLLINLRQQVVEGGRWIARTASSMEQELFLIRSTMIGHAAEEHKDYQMLEKSYVRLGGKIDDILKRPRNVGSEAFTAYMFHQASQPNPVQLFGAMFIIEGLGHMKAGQWGKQIQEQVGLEEKDIIFLAYHSEHDDDHYNKLRMILRLPIITKEIAQKIVKTAKTVARLYILQLEELDNY